LNERSPKPEDFMAKLEEMKESGAVQGADLDKFVCLLSKILDDKALSLYLYLFSLCALPPFWSPL